MMLRTTKPIRTLLPTLLLSIGAGLLVAPTVALAECEGRSETACSSQSSCSWVDSYTRSDGANVNSFCENTHVAKRGFNAFGWWKSKHHKHEEHAKHEKHAKYDKHDKHDKHEKHEKYDKHDKHKENAKDWEHKKVQGKAFDEKSKHASIEKSSLVKKDGKHASSKASKVSNSPKPFKSSKSLKSKSKAKKSAKAKSSAKKKSNKRKSKRSYSKKKK